VRRPFQLHDGTTGVKHCDFVKLAVAAQTIEVSVGVDDDYWFVRDFFSTAWRRLAIPQPVSIRAAFCSPIIKLTMVAS